MSKAATTRLRCSPVRRRNSSARRRRSSISPPPARLRRRSNGTPIRPKADLSNDHADLARRGRPPILLPTVAFAPAKSPATSTCATTFWCRRKVSSTQIAAQMSSALSDTTTAGTRGHVRRKYWLRCRHRRPVEREYDPGHLYRWVECAAQRHDRAGRRSDRAAVVEYGDDESERYRHWRRFFRRPRRGRGRSSIPRSASTGLQFSNPSGSTLEVLDSGPGTITVNSVSTTTTATSLTGGSGALPLFVDGATPYTGAITAAGAESTGYAGRIAVNSALVADPSKLVTYQVTDDGRRRDAAELHLQPAGQCLADLFSGDRHRRHAPLRFKARCRPI